MGDNPGNSALNSYLQSWDVPNLFVQGATAFPQNAGYNPTGTVGALAYLVGRGDPLAVSQESGAARPCVRKLTCSPRSVARCCSPARHRAGRWPRAAGIDKQDFSQIERGHYLAIVGDCAACHTLPGSGRDLAGGRPIETPFGQLVAPNITPDPETGIGAWTDDEFVDALTKGTGRDGTHLYPAMPYTYYTKVTRDDALAIRAYLNTIPAVHNEVKVGSIAVPARHPHRHGGLE